MQRELTDQESIAIESVILELDKIRERAEEHLDEDIVIVTIKQFFILLCIRHGMSSAEITQLIVHGCMAMQNEINAFRQASCDSD